MTKQEATIDTPSPPAAELTFEESLTELERLVDALEKGDLTLEQSLSAFERGVGLTRDCQKALSEAEQKVQILTAKSDQADPEAFEQ